MVKVEFLNDNCLEPTADGSDVFRIKKGEIREYAEEADIPVAFRKSVKILSGADPKPPAPAPAPEADHFDGIAKEDLKAKKGKSAAKPAKG